MDPGLLVVLSLGAILFGAASSKLRSTPLTAPLVFVLLGFLVSDSALGLVSMPSETGVLHSLAEMALGLILFADAMHINVAALRRSHSTETRLLLIGLPLTVLCGTLAAVTIFPGLGLWNAAVLATIVTPTDAALGQGFVLNETVPAHLRRALNVESGLNDGLCLPILFVLLCLARVDAHPSMADYWTIFTVKQVLLGPLIGAASGLAGGWIFVKARSQGWMDAAHQRLGLVALALFCFGLANLIGGNGFLATFCAGITIRHFVRSPAPTGFLETESLLLALVTFFVFGLSLVPRAIPHIGWRSLVFAVLALTLVRIVPVVFSLIRQRLGWDGVLVLGWFGPRGVASIVFALVLLDGRSIEDVDVMFATAIITVALSILAHGATANPLARWYARRQAQEDRKPRIGTSEG